MDTGIVSIKGDVRDKDEDSLFLISSETIFEGKRDFTIIAGVADGMGGGEQGEKASRIAMTSIKESLFLLLSSGDMLERRIAEVMEESFREANSEILLYTKEHNLSWMGTTSSVSILSDEKLHVCNIGDSRTYVFRKNGDLKLKTKDHSYVREVIDKGEITEEEAREHPRRNEISRALGIDNQVHPDFYAITIEEGDSVLMCCDGLWEAFKDSELSEFVTRDAPPQQIVEKLVEEANERDGSDNISAILINY